MKRWSGSYYEQQRREERRREEEQEDRERAEREATRERRLKQLDEIARDPAQLAYWMLEREEKTCVGDR